MIGDFNAKSCNWSINDTATPEGAQLDSVISYVEWSNLF